jgi:cytoskeletal protein CcmA (bactofilin family)
MDTDTTVIGSGAEFEGKLKAKDARILGKFRGDLNLTGRLEIGDNARVDGKVQADSAEIAGEYKGELAVRSLMLLEKARVEGTLDAQTLAVRDGAQVNGSITASGKAKAAAAPAKVVTG